MGGIASRTSWWKKTQKLSRSRLVIYRIVSLIFWYVVAVPIAAVLGTSGQLGSGDCHQWAPPQHACPAWFGSSALRSGSWSRSWDKQTNTPPAWCFYHSRQGFCQMKPCGKCLPNARAKFWRRPWHLQHEPRWTGMWSLDMAALHLTSIQQKWLIKSTFLRCAHPGGVCCRQRLVGLCDSFAKKMTSGLHATLVVYVDSCIL